MIEGMRIERHQGGESLSLYAHVPSLCTAVL
jgi:hypothetical protein